MPGLRRLRGVTKKVSGVLAAALDEVVPEPAPEAAPEAPADTRGEATSPPPADTRAEATSPPPAEPPADEESPTVQTATDEPTAAAPAVDDVCAAAVELARAAAVEVAGPAVGDHLGVEREPGGDGDHVVTHSFATTSPAYVGWRWAVTVARAEGSDAVTVDEVVLLPGSGALLAPSWVPWNERIQPGDLTPGDLLPPAEDDERLVPSYADVDAEELPHDLHRELGLGRPRVLSREGRLQASERWYDGEQGPGSAMAKAAPGRCGDCGFLAPLAGQLGRGFGVCANAFAPDDGRVVALLHGCGAHSEVRVELTHTSATSSMAVEDEELELVPSSPDDAPDSPDAG